MHITTNQHKNDIFKYFKIVIKLKFQMLNNIYWKLSVQSLACNEVIFNGISVLLVSIFIFDIYFPM